MCWTTTASIPASTASKSYSTEYSITCSPAAVKQRVEQAKPQNLPIAFLYVNLPTTLNSLAISNAREQLVHVFSPTKLSMALSPRMQSFFPGIASCTNISPRQIYHRDLVDL